MSRAEREAGRALKDIKVKTLNKDAECDLHERGNSYNGKQARKAKLS